MTSGIGLASSFFAAEVRPIIESAFPTLGCLAARLGSGSDVLGLDDERSQDHDFGCRLTLLVDATVSTVAAFDQRRSRHRRRAGRVSPTPIRILEGEKTRIVSPHPPKRAPEGAVP